MHFAGILVILLVFAPASVQAQSSLEFVGELEIDANLEEAARLEAQLQNTLEELMAKRRELEQRRGGRARSTGGDSPEVLGNQYRIVNGVLTFGFPATGALLHGSSAATAGSWCTGTLIGSRSFLTANHCVEGNRDPATYWVYLQSGGIYAVESISPEIAGYDFPEKDLALLRLAQPVEGIAPVALNQSTVIADGTNGIIVGFGRSGGLNQDYGLKRLGRIVTASCDRPETTLLCWDFTAPVGLPGLDSNTCNADSGGPLFVDLDNDGTLMVAGVTSGGTRTNCLAGDHSYDVDVRQFSDWIVEQAGDDIGRAAESDFGQVGTPSVRVLGANDELANGAVSYVLHVPSGIGRLRVALNGEDLFSTNFDLFVRRDGTASATENNCTQVGSSQYGFCEFQVTGPDTWSIMVQQTGAGSGRFQVVATLFESP